MGKKAALGTHQLCKAVCVCAVGKGKTNERADGEKSESMDVDEGVPKWRRRECGITKKEKKEGSSPIRPLSFERRTIKIQNSK